MHQRTGTASAPCTGTTVPVGHTCCAVTMQLVPKDDSVAAVVTLLLRKRWSILELRQRRTATHDDVYLLAAKAGGTAELLISALEREVMVIQVLASPDRAASDR